MRASAHAGKSPRGNPQAFSDLPQPQFVTGARQSGRTERIGTALQANFPAPSRVYKEQEVRKKSDIIGDYGPNARKGQGLGEVGSRGALRILFGLSLPHLPSPCPSPLRPGSGTPGLRSSCPESGNVKPPERFGFSDPSRSDRDKSTRSWGRSSTRSRRHRRSTTGAAFARSPCLDSKLIH